MDFLHYLSLTWFISFLHNKQSLANFLFTLSLSSFTSFIDIVSASLMACLLLCPRHDDYLLKPLLISQHSLNEIFNETSFGIAINFFDAFKIESFLRNCSFLTLFISMIFYWIQTAFSSSSVISSSISNYGKDFFKPFSLFKEGIKLRLSFMASNISSANNRAIEPDAKQEQSGALSFLKVIALAIKEILEGFKLRLSYFIFNTSKLTLINFGTITMIISNILLSFLLIFRWIESGHFPLSNLYESLMFLSWSCTFIHLFLELNTEGRWPRPDAIFLTKVIGSITSPIALFTNAFATFNLPIEMQKASPLVPALQSNWLMMHVTLMIISYSALILGSLLSIAFLILTFNYGKAMSCLNNSLNDVAFTPGQDQGMVNLATLSKGTKDPIDFQKKSKVIQKHSNMRNIKQERRVKPPLGLWPFERIKQSGLKSQNFFSASSNNKGPLVSDKAMPTGDNLWFMAPKPSTKITLAWNFDNLSYRIIGIGFPFLTIGILSGAVWANEAWGSYWSWDPKETWALATWLVFAIYLHSRITKGWQGKKPAIIASFGFIAIWICFLGVNLIGEGMHSYGFISI